MREPAGVEEPVAVRRQPESGDGGGSARAARGTTTRAYSHSAATGGVTIPVLQP
jgi:hypothetical protein